MTDDGHSGQRNLDLTSAELEGYDSLDSDRDSARRKTKLPWVPPEIWTFQPDTELPPDVITEWGAKRLLCSETDDEERHELRLVQSRRRVTRWLQSLRTLLSGLGPRHPKPEVGR